jgi:tetratricopeptide (TPR) repeat protein
MHYDLSENEALDLEYRENARKEAESAYQKSIQLDSTKFDAQFNLGALYYNRAAHLQTKANDYPIYMNKSQRAEYDKLIADAKEYLQIALGPMEKAFSIKGDDYATIDTLIKIYTRLGASDEKILKLNDLLKTL